jgi:hypothetical protein
MSTFFDVAHRRNTRSYATFRKYYLERLSKRTLIDDIFSLADKTEYINALASYQLLIIDDLGVERNSEYVLGIIFSVIDRRFEKFISESVEI